MTTTTTTCLELNPNTPEANNSDAKAKAKEELDTKKENKKRRRQREKDKKNSNNKNNYVKFNRLITYGIMTELTISSRSSAKRISDFSIFRKLAAAYTAAKGCKHWTDVIELLEPIPDKEWKTERPNKSMYSVKRTTKV